jgi:hypothetical protein
MSGTPVAVGVKGVANSVHDVPQYVELGVK